MNIKDQGIILSVRKYSENSLIVKILSQNNGIYSGFIKSALSSKKHNAIYQSGNLVEFIWQAKNEENLGFFKLELVKSFLANILSDPIRLNSVNSIITIITQNMPERQENQELFLKLYDLLQNLVKTTPHFIADYIHLEIDLLQNLGYGIELDKCAVTEAREDLCFVSPKSGRAVSRNIGAKYADKLLKLPEFLIKDNNFSVNKDDLLKGLELSGFFIDKYLYKPTNSNIPQSRIRLTNLIKNI